MAYFNKRFKASQAVALLYSPPRAPTARCPWGRTYPFVLEPPKLVLLLLGLWEADILFLFLSFLVLFAK